MNSIVVDSSVAMKWYVPEDLADEAAALLGGSFELAAPDLLYPEFGNILWKKVGRGEVKPDEAREIIAAVRRVPFIVVSSAILLDAALEIAVAYKRTVYDALYMALAVAHDSVFVTADDTLVRALAGGPLAPHVVALSAYGVDPATE